jgi:hypothetical protein
MAEPDVKKRREDAEEASRAAAFPQVAASQVAERMFESNDPCFAVASELSCVSSRAPLLTLLAQLRGGTWRG